MSNHPTIPSSINDPRKGNDLLRALSPADYGRIRPDLVDVQLEFGETLYEPGQRMEHVYYPANSLVSLLTVVDGHLPLEVGLIGYEGMVGIGLALGEPHSVSRAVVQGGGNAARMKSKAFLAAFGDHGAPHRNMMRYAHALMAQVSQTAACNQFHRVEARLARWLLMTQDRLRSSEFVLTQEYLSHMLGVRRVGVTKAARSLMEKKLIAYSRGTISVTDRAGLQAAACSCYDVMRKLQAAATRGNRPSRARAQ